MKKLFIVLFSIPSLLIQAQTITGVVANEKDKSPVEFAPIALLQLPDSNVINGLQSLLNGTFSFANLKPGNYFVKASFVGFTPAGKEVVIRKDDNEIRIDTLFLQETSKEIEEVVVTGERIKGKELVDRTVYSIPAEVSKASPNAYDVLKKIPAISVDYNDNVSLNGSNNFIIQVDGKQRDKEYLARLQPSDIETIEVINNPSGKYEGNIDGVINIKLKREARFGYSGNFNVAGRPSKQTSANIAGSLDYAMGNATAYISGYGFYNNLNSDVENNANMKLPNEIDSSYSTLGNGNYKFSAASVNTGIDYFYDKYQTFSLNVNYKPVGNSSSMDQNSSIFLNNINNINQTFYSNTDNFSHEINSSAFYKRQFEKPLQELTTELTYYYFISNDSSFLNKSTFKISDPNHPLSFQRGEKSDGNRNSINLKVDYVHPINMDIKFETGVQVYRQQMDFEASYIQNSVYDSLKNNYKYTELRSGVYAGLSYSIGKWGLQATFRVENSMVDINKTSTDNYFTFLPSSNIMYKFSSKNNTKLTYNRRINRPNITQLNPFEKVGFNDEINSGNAYLKPELRDRVQLTHTLNIGKSYIAPYVYYEYFNEKIADYSHFAISSRIKKDTKITMPSNVLTGYEQGVGLNAMIFFVNINFRYFEGHFNEFADPNKPNNKIAERNYSSYSIGGWAFAPLPWKMNWFAFANYTGENATAQGTMQSPFFYGTGLRKEIGNHTIGAFYLLPFINRLTVYNNEVTTPVMHTQDKASFDSRFFIQFQYSYKFNKGKASRKVQRQTEVESDSKKGGLGAP